MLQMNCARSPFSGWCSRSSLKTSANERMGAMRAVGTPLRVQENLHTQARLQAQANRSRWMALAHAKIDAAIVPQAAASRAGQPPNTQEYFYRTVSVGKEKRVHEPVDSLTVSRVRQVETIVGGEESAAAQHYW